MAKKKQSKFPKQLFVRVVAEGGDDEYHIADESIDSSADGETVAVYELKSIHIKRVTHTIHAI